MTLFLVYNAFLIVAGIALLAVAISGWGATAVAGRVINGIVGAAFIGYAIYLLFFSTSSTYHIFLYAFILPILLIVQALRNAGAKKAAKADAQP